MSASSLVVRAYDFVAGSWRLLYVSDDMNTQSAQSPERPWLFMRAFTVAAVLSGRMTSSRLW